MLLFRGVLVQEILENGFTWINSITYTSLFISHAVHAFAYRIYHIKSKGCSFIALTVVLVGKHSFSFMSERVKPQEYPKESELSYSFLSPNSSTCKK